MCLLISVLFTKTGKKRKKMCLLISVLFTKTGKKRKKMCLLISIYIRVRVKIIRVRVYI